MNVGTSKTNLKTPPQTGTDFPSREELGVFFDLVHNAANSSLPGETPGIEAPRKIIEHFNRGRMAGIDSVGYFIYEGVKVFEEGKRLEAEKRDALTAEEKVFGKKA